MTRKFYGYRQGHKGSLTVEFQAALNETLDSLGEQRYFLGGAPMKVGGWSHWNTAKKVRELVGFDWRPPSASGARWQTNSEVYLLQLVEAMYELAFEKKRDDYAEKVNALFQRFNQPYQLVDGQVHSTRSEVLSAMVEELPTRDEELRGLLARAAEEFFYAKEDRRERALDTMADALERAKTLLGGDKKASVEEIIRLVTERHPQLRAELDAVFDSLSDFHNSAMLRHKETGQVAIRDDPRLIEFQFYSYYNLIRLCLHRLAEAEAEASEQPARAD